MNDKDILLELYKVYVQTAENTSDRRLRSNSFYLAICSSLIAISYVLIRLDAIDSIWVVGLGVFGALLSVVWWLNIKSYKALNSGKFKVILELEEQLPFACFTKEWEALGHIGNKPKIYRLLTKVEGYVPLIFAFIYILMIVWCVGDHYALWGSAAKQ